MAGPPIYNVFIIEVNYMKKQFEGKVAFVTGGASGMGKATVCELVNRGAKVIFADLNDSKAQKVVDECREMGGEVDYKNCDITVHSNLIQLFQYIREKYGKLDFAANVAGSGIPSTRIDETSDAEIDMMIDLNLKALIYCMIEEIKLMREQHFGRIVNIASGAANIGTPGMSVLAASKAGVVGVTKNACFDVVRDGITINSISPGSTETELVQSIKYTHSEEYQSYCNNTPMGRFGMPKEIAHGICFFFEPESAFITGVNLPIDGGFCAGKMDR